MAISMMQDSALPRYRAWLIANWPAALWILAAIIVSIASAKSVPEAFRQSVAMVDTPEADRAEMRRALAGLHLTNTFLVWVEIVTNLVNSAICLVIGWLLVRRSSRGWFAIYLAFVLLGLANANFPPAIDDVLPGQPVAQFVVRLATAVGVSGLFMLPFLVPNGRFVPRWTAIWGLEIVASVFSFAFFPSFDPGGRIWSILDPAITVLLILSLLYSIAYRYRKVSTPDERRQTKWVMFGLGIGVPGFFVGDALMRNIGATPVGVFCLLAFLIVMPIAFSLPPVTIGIAILHHRLFDIDVILNRTLVWLAMSASVIGAYIGVVVGIGSLIGSERSLLLSLLTTGAVAVAFQPVYNRVQRLVSRLLFGDRDDPYSVLARLGHHIEDSLSSADLLPEIVRTTAEMLRLPYAALFLERANGPILVASTGSASSATLRLPLMYQGTTVGALEVAPRRPGEAFGQADRKLLEDLARQIGVAARTVNLADDLQHSRERIVTSREEERRRLRRDLHDGLGAQLAALTMQAGAAQAVLRSDPDAAERQIAELREELRAAVADVRRLVLGLRPPALDELGLAGALQTRLMRFDTAGGTDAPTLRVLLKAGDDLPALSAAVEVAAFRIVEEAVTNVVKHARATRVDVALRVEHDRLRISVIDDGVGIPHALESFGIGLQTMRERATELGGSCVVVAGPADRGTEVRVALPATAGEGARDRWNAHGS